MISENATSENLGNELPDFLIELLDSISRKEGFENSSLAVRGSSNHGNGFSGPIIRIHVVVLGERNGVDDELSLICKLIPSSDEYVEQFNLLKVFRREVLMYNEVLTTMNNFQIEKGVTIKDGFFQYPKCYGTVDDEANDCFAIVMEDLKKSGYELYDKHKPSEFNHVKLLMESLGKFHAVSFALKDQKPSVFDKFKNLDDLFSAQLQQPTLQSMFQCSYDRAILACKGDIANEKAIHTLKNWKNTFLRDLATLSDGRKSEPFSVINHGDCWNNNVMFKYDKKANIPEEICLLDWQLSRYSSPALDLTYFIFSSTDRKLREYHYDKLIKIYYKALSSAIVKLGSNSEKLFTFDDLSNELKLYGRFGLIYAPVLLKIVTSKTDGLPDIEEVADSAGGVNLTENEYRERVRDAMKDGSVRESSLWLKCMVYVYMFTMHKEILIALIWLQIGTIPAQN